ncbi:hypothetical protein BBJ28_00018653 [Nothophytophthora sp. Chile5]|nr:hypothetical protein BBJ28_00018653 [Nothophytophthora sp. Chile5]
MSSRTVLTPARSRTRPPNARIRRDADASRYFAIETRLELKARLAKLRPALRRLLVQAKLAWLRCSLDAPAASQLVQQGEALASALARAFAMASGAESAPLAEYQALVARVECELATFQSLVASVATGSFQSPGEEDEEGDESPSEEEEGEEEVTYPRHPQRFDLPSMATYCQQVAPPYSSYLSTANGKKA